jgi:hypothetical protein
MPVTAQPSVTQADAAGWNTPSTAENDGVHQQVPALTQENAANNQSAFNANRQLGQALIAQLKQKKGVDPAVAGHPKSGTRFVLEWRIFPNAENPNVGHEAQCGCGCSCACGCS